MGRYLTRTINLARHLVQVERTRGRSDFLAELRARAAFLAGEYRADPAELDRQLGLLVSALVEEWADHRPEKAIRQRALFPDTHRQETRPAAKVDRLAADCAAFLQAMDREQAEERLAERVVAFLKECPLEDLRDLTLESLADRFQYSRNHFAERFRQEQGQTVHDVLTHERMNRAFRLLSGPPPVPTVKELTRRLGFSDPVYFSRLFRKKYGLLPSAVARAVDCPGSGPADRPDGNVSHS